MCTLILKASVTNTRKRARSLSCIPLLFLTTVSAFAQNTSRIISDSISPRHNIGFRIEAAPLQRGTITTTGGYKMKSRIQSSFSGGFVYQVNLDDQWNISYGIELNLTNTNYYLHIPDSELKGYPSTEGAPQIEDKQAYFKLSLPVLLSRNFLSNKKRFYSIRGGGKINYSSFSADERTYTQIADSSGQLTNIFTADFTSRNNGKPWLTYIVAVSRGYVLKGGSKFSIEVFAELSTVKFIKGHYEITVPNQPISEGTFSVKGSCIGVSLQLLPFVRKRR